MDSRDVMKKGPWSSEEDQKLIAYIRRYGIWNWNHMAAPAGLARSGKSCRLRWMNYLRPNIRHGNFTLEEEEIIIKWQQVVGNKWSLISSKLEGRTDNEVKNYWNTRLKKRFGAQEMMRLNSESRSVCDAAAAAAGVKSEFEDDSINCSWIKEEAAESSSSGDDTTSDNQMLLVDSETEIRDYWDEEELYTPMSIVAKDFDESMFMFSNTAAGGGFISPYYALQESFSHMDQYCCIDDINLWEN